MTDWQDKRSISPREFERYVLAMGISRSAMGRFLGVSERTMRRYLSGEATIPVSVILLLRLMLELDIKPKAPKRPRRPVVADHQNPTSP